MSANVFNAYPASSDWRWHRPLSRPAWPWSAYCCRNQPKASPNRPAGTGGMIVCATVGIDDGGFHILAHDRPAHDVLACFETGYANDFFGAKCFGEFLGDRKCVQVGTVAHVISNVIVHGWLVKPEHVLLVGQRETILR